MGRAGDITGSVEAGAVGFSVLGNFSLGGGMVSLARFIAAARSSGPARCSVSFQTGTDDVLCTHSSTIH